MLKSEVLQILQTTKVEVMNTVESSFENAKTKLVASLQRGKYDHEGESDILLEDNRMAGNNMISDFHGREMPDITATAKSSEESENEQRNFDSIEDNQEAVIRDNLNRYELYVSDCVKTTDLIAFFGPFSSAQTKTLRSIYKRNPVDATKTALKMIQKMKNHPKKYTLLLEALTDAGYLKVVQILDGTLIPVGSCHRNIIRDCAKYMFNQLHTSEILPYLHKKGVINNHDRQEVLQTERTESTSIAALELLDMLPNKNKKWFRYFVESLVESGHEDLARLVKESTNNIFDTSKLNRIPSPTSQPSNCQPCVHSLQLDHWLDHLDNTYCVNAYERPQNNIIGCSSVGLNQKNICRVLPDVLKHSLRKSSSNDDNTFGINDKLESITRPSENQSMPSIPDRVSSPISVMSVSSDDQSCVQSSRLDRGFDLFDNITDNTVSLEEFEMPYDDLIEYISAGIKGTEDNEKETIYPEIPQPKQFFSKFSAGGYHDSDTYNSAVSLPHENKSIKRAFDKTSTHVLMENLPLTISASSNKSLNKASDDQNKVSLPNKASLPSSVSSDKSASKTSANQSKSSPPDKTPSPSSVSKNKSANKTSDNQNKSSPPDKTLSPSSISNDKTTSKTSDNQSKSSIPDKTPSPSSISYDKSTSKTSDNQTKSSPPDKTPSPSSISNDKSTSETSDNQSKSSPADKTPSPSSISNDKSTSMAFDNKSKSSSPDKTPSWSSLSNDKSTSETSDNQSKSSPPDKPPSPSSISNDKSASMAFDNQNKSSPPDKTHSPSSVSNDKSLSRAPNNQSKSSPPDKTPSPSSVSNDKSASNTSDYHSKSSPPDKKPSPSSVSNDKSANKTSDIQSKTSSPDKTPSPSSISNDKSDNKTSDDQSKSSPPDKSLSPSSVSNDKSPSRAPDNQSKSSLPTKTPSPSSISNNKSSSKTSDNQSESSPPDKTHSSSSKSNDKSTSKTSENQSKTSPPDKTPSPSSISNYKSASKTSDKNSKSSPLDKPFSPSSIYLMTRAPVRRQIIRVSPHLRTKHH